MKTSSDRPAPTRRPRLLSFALPSPTLLLRLRRVDWLARLYRLLPMRVRARISRLAWQRMQRSMRFPLLPPVVVHTPAQATMSATCARGPAVNIFGFMGGQFGLGECARLYARALDASGFAVSARDIRLDLPHAWSPFTHQAMRRPLSTNGWDLVVVNPDYLEAALAGSPLIGRGSGRPLIGVWFWELGNLPDAWRGAFERVDAVMVASRFVEDALRPHTNKPLLRVPIPLMELADSQATREDFGLPNDAFIFLTSFDFHSSIHRKNPHAAIEAFRIAFDATRCDVALVVKSVNGHHYPEQQAALVAAAHGDPRILLRDGVIEAAHVGALQRCCDAYVSLHRAEGFGLGLAESMARGKPVVATAWSGNTDFMDDEVARLVRCTLIPVAASHYQGETNSMWAEPDIDEAARHMRALADDPDAARALGEKAARHVADLLSPSRIGRMFGDALKEMSLGSTRC